MLNVATTRVADLSEVAIAHRGSTRARVTGAVEMSLESRYVVLKIADVQSSLSTAEQSVLARLVQKVDNGRQLAGKDPFKAVVVEADWPEYPTTVGALETRISSQQREAL